MALRSGRHEGSLARARGIGLDSRRPIYIGSIGLVRLKVADFGALASMLVMFDS
jgi:hypothetical protein